jgi:hypothetical protein
MFGLIGRNDPPAITQLMIPSILEKFTHSAAVIILVLQRRMHPSDLVFAGTDLILGVLFVIAYFRTPRRTA